MKHLVLVVAIAMGSAACDGSSPSAPSPIGGPQPPNTPPAVIGLRPLFGYVSDTAFRAVADVRLEVTTGPQTGLVAQSDARGQFSFEQPVSSPSTVRAVKDGYEIGTRTSVLTSDGRAYVGFSLASLSPPAAVAGSYMLTITADSACDSLPDEVRTRTYPVTVRVAASTAPANTRFDGLLAGGRFAPFANMFFVGVFGDYVTINTQGEGPTIVEEVGANRYVAFNGGASATVGPEGLTAISVPFGGTIEYCELAAPIGQDYDCSETRAAVRHECQSSRHQLSLTRR